MFVSNNNYRDYNDTSEATLTVENLSKVYASAMGKVVSLRKVNFTVNKGEFVSVVGPSGSRQIYIVEYDRGFRQTYFR